MSLLRDTGALYEVRQAFVYWRRNEDDEAMDVAAIDQLIDTIDAALDLAENEDAGAWLQAVKWVCAHVLSIYLTTNRADLQDFAQRQSRFLADHGITPPITPACDD
ncbi:hypothetical protein WI58_19855 [Burkholderia cepacia]|uniref:hypothetical protein n=1 Tax=Burkholderia cepacia TaxID=292 RepID=UPI000754BF66|nr:hypothetical protein [Burkholderia cepacia]KVA53982.1 hypothetical protein WI48_02040 [Burkholderia cepacia]KVA54490.1 hypothetical protein WI47_10685 [Burkholderia cepacia]KVA63560.1 hypothetical protein WI49_20675 [Burkholderia cepacia]KVA82887.1 hypothetical protein WI51_24580 [Burkholderia cepacia]KVA85829.1 hypothetical protein WI50_16855 [Burkholderia cepacia]